MTTVAAPTLALDHLIVAADSLQTGGNWLHKLLGQPLQPGGRHSGWGTHNLLMQLGGGTYLELIAADPEQPEPAQPRPFGLDDPMMKAQLAVRPHLVHFVLRTDDIEAVVRGLRYDPGPIRAMSRGELNWRITVARRGQPAGGGLLPTIIQWDVPRRPAENLPDQGVRLKRLRIVAPGDVVGAMPALPGDARFVAEVGSTAAAMTAELQTPSGFVSLGDPD